jgi:hypothetical protein
MFSVLFATAALAAQPVARPISSLPDPAPAPSFDAPAADAPPAPAATEGVRALLRARHTADLPDRATLDAHPGAEAALQWLAQHGETLIEAERAAGLLALYSSTESAETCSAILQSGAHAKIRAGAARCLAGQSADVAQPLLVRSLADTDVRVGVAAADALKTVPGAVEALEPALLETLPAVVKAHLQ